METKNEIFTKYKKEYTGASKERKGSILDMVCEVTGIHRKAAVRKFRTLQLRDTAKQEGRGRRVYYDNAVTAALRDVWEAAGEICAELLCPIATEYVRILERDKMWTHSDEATGKLLAMSEGTMKARVGAFMKARRTKHGLSATSPSALKHIIPMKQGPWTDAKPGEGQDDTVVHSGDTLAGDMAYTLTHTDMATMWTILRAQWNKGQEVTLVSITDIRARLPWTLLGLHPDSGSEFINWHLKGWCDEEGIALTRSRPSKKNDNCHVEERNGHIVRKYLGYTRIDTPEAVGAMNELYDVLCPYLNHFIPTRRTKEKRREGAKYKRTYEIPMTPYARAMAHSDIATEVKRKLRQEHDVLNPSLMKKEIDRLIARVFDVQKWRGDPGIQSSVR
jgi:hypothetical protein